MTKPHYLRPAAKTWTPPVVVSFDTETYQLDEGDDRVHRLRCWAAVRRTRGESSKRYPQLWKTWGTDTLGLVEVIDQAFGIDQEVWGFAHNLGFDLSTTSLPFVLTHQGWHVKDLWLGDESCWWSLRKDRKRLLLTDSWSWVRCGLEDAAKDIRRRKVPLPREGDPIELWAKRCLSDASLLDEVMASIMDWWEDNDLGRFGITGSGCGWAAMRRQLPPKSLLVGPNEERTAFERKALTGGRQEVYIVGEVHGVWCGDYDLVSAYATIAALRRLPVKALRYLPTVDRHFLLSDIGPDDVIANVTISTTRPVAPCRVGSDVWWPTGTFKTTLTGPELRYAEAAGAAIELHDGWLYRVDSVLFDWAWWCLGLAIDRDHTTPPLIRRMAKNWGRSVVGRFAARTSRVVAERPAEHLGWHLETGHDLRTGAQLDVLTIGGVERTTVRDVDPDDCSPAVTAFVEGWCRSILGAILDSREPSRLLQCNTDGWWERKVVNSRDYMTTEPMPGITVARKRLTNSVTIIGPNHVQTPTERNFAGVSKEATRTPKGKYIWHDWPGLRWQLENAEPGTFRQPSRTVEIAEGYVRRWVLDNGETIPATCRVNDEGENELLPWSETRGRFSDDKLAQHQVEALTKLIDWPEYTYLPDRPRNLRERGRLGPIR